MSTLENRAARFLELHRQGCPLIMPNAWSAGSAVALADAGFLAIGTTSAGLAVDLGLVDGEVGRAATLANAGAVAASVDVPVSADLENGFSDLPDGCADTIRKAMALGLAGASIEDATGRIEDPIYSFEFAVSRVRAAVAAARTGRFVVTARCENFLHGRPDLDDTINRLQAFEKVGADVLFAPGLPDIEAIRIVCTSVTAPVSVLVAPGHPRLTAAAVTAAGASRISMGSALARAATSFMVSTALEMRDGVRETV
jgi:2-methylisocitrate lyase-like PEP mutase family enzyme